MVRLTVDGAYNRGVEEIIIFLKKPSIKKNGRKRKKKRKNFQNNREHKIRDKNVN
jgi:hypothetical protein